ncbi:MULTISPECIES: dTDP-4-dehydrorhamnose 3,5-epimerase [Corynebacterium]|uniref:dTDP-4-dehydrorhamnose 3,5-epimerase n=1 Tax=Corynebacterium TaxID=1716 RepID=UPI00124E0CE6|nr:MULTISPECIES: dTDP-4-dehydrorhamnose 3,5-epimerase [Corynebacterium]
MLHELSTLPSFYTEPTVHPDARGSFHEWFKATEFESFTGHPFALQQANMSVSRAGVLRGLHFTAVFPGQQKYVTCVSGEIWDVLVDVRLGSETFGRWEGVTLSEENRRCLYIPDGFAHGFAAVRDSTVCYLTSSEYDPNVDFGVDPLDSSLGIEWPVSDPILSDKDRAAPGLDEARDHLPTIEDCEELLNMYKDGWVLANEEAQQ